MKKGFRYFLGCATIAVSSIFVAGCGEPTIKDVKIDADEIQFKMQLSEDSLTASTLTEQLKRQIFNELNASVVLSNGTTEALEWSNDVSIVIDQSEDKVWGKDTGLFKFKLSYNNQTVNFYVQVDAVTTGMDVSQYQSFKFEHFIAKGGNQTALESLVQVSLVQRSGFDDAGEAKYSYLPLKTDVQRAGLSFEWVTEPKAGIDPLPQTGDIGVGTYQCVVSYTVPGTSITYTSQAVDVKISQSSNAVIQSGATAGYAKIANSQITQSQISENLCDIELSGNIAFEKATDVWNDIEINQSAGNVAILKFVAPSGIKTENCKNPSLTVYKADGTPNLGSAVGTNYQTFLNSKQLEDAYFYWVLSFENISTCYQFDILWNENDVVRSYQVRLNQSTAVLEAPEVVELQASWNESANTTADDALILSYGFLPSDTNEYANYVNLLDITEDGQIEHTSQILANFSFSFTNAVDIYVPGVYERGIKVTRKDANGNLLSGEKNVAYLKVYISEPNYGSVYVAENYSYNQSVSTEMNQDNTVCTVLVDGEFSYYNYADMQQEQLIEGYILGAKIEAPQYVPVSATSFSAIVYISHDLGQSWQQADPESVPQLLFDANTAYFNLYMLSQSKNDIAKIVVTWNGNVSFQTYVLKFAQNAIFELGEIELNTTDSIYTDQVYSTVNGSAIYLYGQIPFNQTNLGNIVPLKITAPYGVQYSSQATVRVYKLTTAGKNYLIDHFFDEDFDISKIKYNDKIDASSETSPLFFEISGSAQSLNGCSDGQAFTNLNLDFASEEIYRIVIDWAEEIEKIYEYTVVNMATPEIEEATEFDVAFDVGGSMSTQLTVDFGTSYDDVELKIKQNLIATITTENRTIVTDNYIISLDESQTYNGFSAETVYTFNIEYSGNSQETLSKSVTIKIANPELQTQIKTSDETYYFEQTTQSGNIATFNVSGIVQKTADGYAVNFEIFDPLSIGNADISYTNNTNLVLKILKLSDTSSVEDSSTWQWVDDVVYTNAQSISQIAQSLYRQAEDEYVYGWSFAFNKIFAQNVGDTILPFAIQICWNESLTQTFVINLTTATLQHNLSTSELEAVAVSGAVDSNLTLTKNTSTSYEISGVLAMNDINAPTLTHRLEISFDAPTGFVFDAKNTALSYYFNNQTDQKTDIPLSVSDGKLNLIFNNDMLDANTINIEILWGAEWFSVLYQFDIQSLKLAGIATTNVLNTTDLYPATATVSEMSNDLYKDVTLNCVLQKATSDNSFQSSLINGSTTDILRINAGDYLAHLKLSSNIMHNSSVKIGVLYSQDGQTYSGVPQDADFEDYRIWYDATVFLTSQNNQDAVLDIYLPYTLVYTTALYNIKVMWDEASMPVEVLVKLSDDSLFMASSANVLANDGASDTRATQNTVVAETNTYNTTHINASTNLPFNKYFKNYVISGISNFEDVSELDFDTNFVAGIKISVPTDFVNTENAVLNIYAKRNCYQNEGFLKIATYENGLFISSNVATLLLPISELTDEFIVEINWDSQSRYATEYMHFSLSSGLQLNLNNTTTMQTASVYPQDIQLQQTGKNIEISGSINYQVNDANLQNGYFVAGRFDIPTAPASSFLTFNINNILFNVLKYDETQSQYVQLAEENFVVIKTSNYIEIGIKVESTSDVFKIDVNWNTSLPLATESYIVSFANDTQFVLAGTNIQLYDGGYGWTEGGVLNTTEAKVDGGQELKTVYEISGNIGFFASDSNFGINSDGFVVALQFSAPEGIEVDSSNVSISLAKGQYVTSRFDDPLVLGTGSNAIFNEETKEIALYLKITDISDAFKVLIKWNNSHIEQTIYISLNQNTQFVIAQNVVVSADKTFSGNTKILNSNLIVNQGCTLTVKGTLTLDRTNEDIVNTLINNGTISFVGENSGIVLGNNVDFINNGKITNYNENRITKSEYSTNTNIKGINVQNDQNQAYCGLDDAIIQTANNGTITLLNNIETSFVIEADSITVDKTITISGGTQQKTICPFELQTNNLNLVFNNIKFETDKEQSYNITVANFGKLVGEDYITLLQFENCVSTTGVLIKSENLSAIDEAVIPYINSQDLTGITFENGTVLSVYDAESDAYTFDVITTLDALKTNYSSNAVVVFANSTLDVSGKTTLLSSGQTFAVGEETLLITATTETEISINCNLQIAGTVVIDPVVTVTNLTSIFNAKLNLSNGTTAYFESVDTASAYAIENEISEVEVLGTFNINSSTILQNLTYKSADIVVSDEVILPQNAILLVQENGVLTLNENAKLFISSESNIEYMQGATKQGTGEIIITLSNMANITPATFQNGYTYYIQSAVLTADISVPDDVKLHIVGTLELNLKNIVNINLQNLSYSPEGIIKNGNIYITVPNNYQFNEQSEIISASDLTLTNTTITYNIQNATINNNIEISQNVVLNVSESLTISSGFALTLLSANSLQSATTATILGEVICNLSNVELSAFTARNGVTYNITNATVANGANVQLDSLRLIGNLTVNNNSVLTVTDTLEITGNGQIMISEGASVSLANASCEATSLQADNGTSLTLSGTADLSNISSATFNGCNISVLQNGTLKLPSVVSISNDTIIDVFGTLNLSNTNVSVSTSQALNITQQQDATILTDGTFEVTTGNVVFEMSQTSLLSTTQNATYNYDNLTLATSDSIVENANVRANDITISGNSSIYGTVIAQTISLQSNITLSVYGTLQLLSNTSVENGILSIENGGNLNISSIILTTGYNNLSIAEGGTITSSSQMVVNVADGQEINSLLSNAKYVISNATITQSVSIDNTTCLAVSRTLTIAENCALTVTDLNECLILGETATILGEVVCNVEELVLTSENVKENYSYNINSATISSNFAIAEGITYKIQTLNVIDNCTLTVNGTLDLLGATINVSEGKNFIINQNGNIISNSSTQNVGTGTFTIQMPESEISLLTNFISGATYNYTNLTLENGETISSVAMICATNLTINGSITVNGTLKATSITHANTENINVVISQYGILETLESLTIQKATYTVSGELFAENGLTVEASSSLTIEATGTLHINKDATLSGVATFKYDSTIGEGQGATVIFITGEELPFTATTENVDLSQLYSMVSSPLMPENEE